MSRIDYGNELAAAKLQPGASAIIDAYGLAQGQATFAIDTESASEILQNYAQQKIAYPLDVGVNMYSYKSHLLSSKGGVSMITVDYMGIVGNQTTAQITGVSNTSAQPIETHPKFVDFAGQPEDSTTWLNNAMFASQILKDINEAETTTYSFIGFGLNPNGERNIKAGIRQFLKPMQSIRGTIFFENAGDAGDLGASVGYTLEVAGYFETLLPNSNITGALGPGYCLLTAVNAEAIGNTENPIAVKVVYDIMISGDDPWDPDIYGPAAV